ncbi:DUF1330 domain-containing protein [Chitinophaga horti]|uniref:DUF1330 domain-containing protein n=1 Tax=Chitinophaga horti TaxID=2920382 RepID=A0ABY6J1S9_9BACT|nr:DUF1330 domain-containing protein [Chitinophaga horti]UYQ93623.1 DUF1330 domain-containing protein [Chitinophaga horti]
MLYFTQLIYIHPGKEATFHQFEDLALAVLAKHHGKLLLRLRPEPQQLIAGEWETPYEVHLVSFDTEDDFQAFARDQERKQFLHLKEASVSRMVLIRGAML